VGDDDGFLRVRKGNRNRKENGRERKSVNNVEDNRGNFVYGLGHRSGQELSLTRYLPLLEEEERKGRKRREERKKGGRGQERGKEGRKGKEVGGRG
jgi:hypothetical protein